MSIPGAVRTMIYDDHYLYTLGLADCQVGTMFIWWLMLLLL